jgi:hypothetical protein
LLVHESLLRRRYVEDDDQVARRREVANKLEQESLGAETPGRNHQSVLRQQLRQGICNICQLRRGARSRWVCAWASGGGWRRSSGGGHLDDVND